MVIRLGALRRTSPSFSGEDGLPGVIESEKRGVPGTPVTAERHQGVMLFVNFLFFTFRDMHC